MKRFEEWTDMEIEELQEALIFYLEEGVFTPTGNDLYMWVLQERRERREDPHQKKLGEEE